MFKTGRAREQQLKILQQQTNKILQKKKLEKSKCSYTSVHYTYASSFSYLNCHLQYSKKKKKKMYIWISIKIGNLATYITGLKQSFQW